MAYDYEMNEAEKQAYSNYEAALKQYQMLIKCLHGYVPEEWANNPDYANLTIKPDKANPQTMPGGEQNMTKDGLKLLNSYASKLMMSAKQMMSAMGDHKNFNKEQRLLYFDLQQNLKLAKSDLSASESISGSELPSYSKMHRDNSGIIIDTNGHIEKTGSMMSERIPLRYVDNNGNIQKGYFTRDSNSGITLDSICDNCIQSCPSLKDVMEEVRANPNIFIKISNQPGFDLEAKIPVSSDLFPEMLKECGISEASINKVQWNTTAVNSIFMVYKRRGFESINETNRKFGIEDGRNLNQRNAAMSDIATMLGLGQSIAQSESMTIIENGKPVHGTFMKNASGYHFDEIRPDNSEFFNKDIDINYASLGKSCSNMMVIDYICGNADRNMGNLFFQIKANEQGILEYTGVQGIDNDSSFGNITPKNDQVIGKLFSLKSMKYIPEATAVKVANLTKDSLTTILSARGLQPDEINACWDRTKNLQNAIEKGKIIKVKSNEWDKKKFLAQKEASDKEDSLNPFYLCGRQDEIFKNNQAEYNKALKAEENQYMAKELPQKQDQALKEHNKQRTKAGKAPHTMMQLINGVRGFLDKLKGSIVKMFYSQKLSDLKNKEREKQIEKGVADLHSRVEMQDGYSISGQQKKVSEMLHSLREPGQNDSSAYITMHENLKQLSGFLNLLQSELKNPSKDNENLSKLTNGKGQLTDLGENLLAQKFADAEKASKDYIVNPPEKLQKNDMQQLAIAENLHDLCVTAKNARQRKIDDLNDVMFSSMKQINEWGKKLQDAKPSTGDYIIANAAFEAKKELASYVGSLNVPDPEQRKQVNKDLAVLTIAEHMSELKEKNPEVYDLEMKSFKLEPTRLSSMADKLLEDPKFSKMVSDISPANAMAIRAEKYLYKQAKVFEIGGMKDITPSVSISGKSPQKSDAKNKTASLV